MCEWSHDVLCCIVLCWVVGDRDVWVERLDASDRIINTLLKYRYINGSSEADYAIQCLQTWRAELKDSLGRKAVAPASGEAGQRGRKIARKKRLKAKQMFAKMGLDQRSAEDEAAGERS